MSTTEWQPATATELASLMQENFSGPRQRLTPAGGRTMWPAGTSAVSGDSITVSTTGLSRLIDYPTRDLTITVEAGMRVAELRKILKAQEQQLPIDIPQADRATIGGAIATNTSGPGRFGYGTLRDYVIGISAVDGQGRLYSAGGRVVKNVAGYDLCKLLIGSRGTLGIITQVTFKLRPRAASTEFVCVPVRSALQAEQLLAGLNTSETRPMVLDLVNQPLVNDLQRQADVTLPTAESVLCIGFAATAVETAWQVEKVREELRRIHSEDLVHLPSDAALRLWQALTESPAQVTTPLSLQASLLPSRVGELVQLATGQGCGVQAHAGDGVVLIHLPADCNSAPAAQQRLDPLQEFIARGAGDLQVFRGHPDWHVPNLSTRSSARVHEIQREIQRALDPASLLSPLETNRGKADKSLQG
ncbi:FAD-binding oxidoreductase [Planctomicrobium sp. SH664]|uniref:FAD-binding oxidoreductase n=1 Tax=Planctomicrobium sp. SH664 TaxID=3448125 RepID=UPI003F5C6893